MRPQLPLFRKISRIQLSVSSVRQPYSSLPPVFPQLIFRHASLQKISWIPRLSQVLIFWFRPLGVLDLVPWLIVASPEPPSTSYSWQGPPCPLTSPLLLQLFSILQLPSQILQEPPSWQPWQPCVVVPALSMQQVSFLRHASFQQLQLRHAQFLSPPVEPAAWLSRRSRSTGLGLKDIHPSTSSHDSLLSRCTYP